MRPGTGAGWRNRLRSFWRKGLRPVWHDIEWPVVGAVWAFGLLIVGRLAFRSIIYFEVATTIALLIGLFTHLAAIPLIIDMLVAISTTKIPFLIQHGFWAAAHEARVDWCMLLGSLFLFAEGAGKWSLDNALRKRVDGSEPTQMKL